MFWNKMNKTTDNYELLYSPSHWSKRLPKEVIIENHIKFITRSSDLIVNRIPSKLNLKYGPGPRQLYNIMGSDLPPDAPILIVIHGGYWQAEEITHATMIYVSKYLYTQKIKVICIDYDLCPNVTLSEILNQVEMAIKECLDYARQSESRGIYLLGHSAGAHMIATLFNQLIINLPEQDQHLIKAFFLICGIYDISPLCHTTVNDGLKLTTDEALKLSPQFMGMNIPSGITVHVVVAEHDAPPFLEQGNKFYNKLIENNVKSTYNLLNEEDHFSAMERLIEEEFTLTQIILKEIISNRNSIYKNIT